MHNILHQNTQRQPPGLQYPFSGRRYSSLRDGDHKHSPPRQTHANNGTGIARPAQSKPGLYPSPPTTGNRKFPAKNTPVPPRSIYPPIHHSLFGIRYSPSSVHVGVAGVPPARFCSAPPPFSGRRNGDLIHSCSSHALLPLCFCALVHFFSLISLFLTPLCHSRAGGNLFPHFLLFAF